MSRFAFPLGLAALAILVSVAPALAQSSASDAAIVSSSAMEMSGMSMSEMSMAPSSALSSSVAPLSVPAPLSAPSLASSEMSPSSAPSSEAAASPSSAEATPSGPPVNVYAYTGPTNMSPAVLDALPRIYVPNRVSGTVTVIDPTKMKVVGTFRVGFSPQHVVPSWDLKTLYVTNDGNNYPHRGSLTAIDPTTGRPIKTIKVDDPYNMYFTPDGSSAIVVAEAYDRLDFRDPHSFALQFSIAAPGCKGINHADFSADGSYAIFTCEFGDALAKIDLKAHAVAGYLTLSKAGGMPQDIRVSPDGKTFYVADMMSDGVFMVDGASFVETGFIPTGIGTHGFVVSRDGTKLYVSNRGTHLMEGTRAGPGSISTIDFATNKVIANWPIPKGGSPDMGNVSSDGTQLWYSGRFDNVAYMIDTTTGAVTSIRTGTEPHGLAVWPQPGRYSLGHTGNMR